MQLELGTLLKLPSGSPDLPPVEFELGEIDAIETRKVEIAYVNKETAPELMSIFNKGYCIVHRMMTQVSYEYTQAKKYAEKRKAVVTLDVAPEELNRRNLRSSEDLRNAVLMQDIQYEALMDKVNLLEAGYEFLRGKARGFEMAYNSAKGVLYTTGNGLGSMHSGLSGGFEDNTVPFNPLIGKPRY